MWEKRAELLAPLTSLSSKNVKWEWTDTHQAAFNSIKRILGREVLLSYPNFKITFEIFTDASAVKLGALIAQENKPVAFYSRKLSPAQTRYTTIERELLSIVETLKEFRTILWGHHIIIWTDHKNLTFKNFTSERVLRWHLLIEEYNPELRYVPGTTNVVADALSRIELTQDLHPPPTPKYLTECFGYEDQDLDPLIFPLKYTNFLAY